jgi:hypothetical protein
LSRLLLAMDVKMAGKSLLDDLVDVDTELLYSPFV